MLRWKALIRVPRARRKVDDSPETRASRAEGWSSPAEASTLDSAEAGTVILGA